MNQSIAAGGVRRPEIVLRQPYWAVIELVLGAALAATHFLATSSGSFWWDVTGGAAIGCLVVAGLALRFRYRFDRDQVIATELFQSTRTVELTRLTGVIAPDERESFLSPTIAGQKRYLELRDDRGSVVRLSFFGTPRAQRRRFLAALEPYVMADSVYRAGQIGQALSGELWWPRPRLRS